MPQATDIILDGAGYMLTPQATPQARSGGSGRSAGMGYTRAQDGIAEGRTGRITQKDFFGGQHRAYQLERDQSWDGSNVGPAYGGQGVEPWPYSTFVSLDPGQPAASATTRIPHAQIGEYVFYAVGAKLYRTPLTSATSWTTPTLAYTAAAAITSLCYYGGNILLAFGNGADILHVLYPNATSPATLFPFERGGDLVSYGGSAMWSDKVVGGGHYPHRVQQVIGSGIEFKLLDSPIRRLVVAGSRVHAVTDAAMYTFSGRVNEVDIRNPAYNPNDASETDPPTIRALRWSGEFEPFFQHGSAVATDDFVFVVGFGGRLYAWVGKSVMEFKPDGERAGWRDTGLSGNTCFGACVAAGHLIVCIESRDRTSQVWAWDGAGWWLILEQDGMQYPYCWPVALSGAGKFDCMIFLGNSQGAQLVRLVWRDDTAGTYPESGNSAFVTSMIDASERDKAKAWRKVGAVFAAPEARGVAGSGDVVSVFLDYSIDAGANWNQVATATYNFNTLASHNHTLDADVASDAAVSRFLQLRVRWTSVLFWAPVLCGVWSEFETLDSPARRRRWSFAVTAQDQVVDRDGSVLTRTGRQLISELWARWQTGSTLTFRDLDYDDAPTERRVRIVGISESVPAPATSGDWGDSIVALTLVEV